MDLISRADIQTLLERELENGAEMMKPGLKLAMDILKYTPSKKETLWQGIKRKLTRK